MAAATAAAGWAAWTTKDEPETLPSHLTTSRRSPKRERLFYLPKRHFLYSMYITWKHKHTALTAASPLDRKIEVFRERIWGWQLHVADLMANGGRDHDNAKEVALLPHSGFAVLQVLLSYFETIAHYESGDTSEQSARFFKAGVRSVFPELNQYPYLLVSNFLDHLYSAARCGLYHMSMTKPNIAIGNVANAVQFEDHPPRITLNPHKLPGVLKSHLDAYTARLMNPAEVDLREKFRRRFEYDYKS